MSENREEKGKPVSESPIILLSSIDDVWKGFKFQNLSLPKAGFVDATRPALNIEKMLGPMKFRPLGKKNYFDVPVHPRIHPPDDGVCGHWQNGQFGNHLLISSTTFENLVHQSFCMKYFRSINHDDPILDNLLNALHLDVQRCHVDGPLLGETILTAILYHVTKNFSGSLRKISVTNYSQSKFNNIRDYIEDNLAIRISLTGLCKEFDINSRYLHRMFQEKVGVSPYNYILHRRVERAKQMFQVESDALADIATAVGFANQGHMSDTFRRLLGAPPSHFYNKPHMFPRMESDFVRIKETVRIKEDES